MNTKIVLTYASQIMSMCCSKSIFYIARSTFTHRLTLSCKLHTVSVLKLQLVVYTGTCTYTSQAVEICITTKQKPTALAVVDCLG